MRVSPPRPPAIWGGGGPDLAGWSGMLPSEGLAGAPSTLSSPVLPPAWHGTTRRGHWVTCPGSHRSSVAETGSNDCGSLNHFLFPISTEANLAPGPKERGLGETSALFLFWF